MNKPTSGTQKGGSTKRQATREKRRQQQRKQRMYIVLGIVIAAVAVAALLIIPSLLPAEDINTITPVDRPNVDGKALGDPNAPVKIDVYEDFQCPACKTYTTDIEPRVVDDFVATGQVYYVFRQFPFLDDRAIGKESDQAANASMCAAGQDRFWDYHDILFANWNGENQNAYSDKRLVAFAEALNLDVQAFNDCFESNAYEDDINADLNLGKSLGITGTPSVLVNGTLVSPGFVPSYQDIADAVNNALNSSGD
ncbi:MAG TPA: thioredoxin domain-containing protein [Anaerolineales bacterium]|jgi:protein-disulfide isomerase|nr:thioredoxin domain-containing protein [Anaerolineales bacterium]